MRIVALLALALTACGSNDGAPVANNVTFQSASITLPADPASTLPEIVQVNCTACHSQEMILNQPTLPADKWAATVKKMREAYHAPIAPGDDAAIVAQLVTLKR